MQDVSYADYNQILLSKYLQSLDLINIHMCAKIQRGNHHIELAYEVSEVQGTVFAGGREMLMSVVKQELLEKMDTDLTAWQNIIFCSPHSQAIAARKYDSHVSYVSLAFFIQAFS